MFRVDAEIAALPVPMAGQNMKRLVNRRTGPHSVVDELECKGGEEQHRQNGEQNCLRTGLGKPTESFHSDFSKPFPAILARHHRYLVPLDSLIRLFVIRQKIEQCFIKFLWLLVRYPMRCIRMRTYCADFGQPSTDRLR